MDGETLYGEIVALIESKGLNIPSDADQMLGDATSIIAEDEFNKD